jgi:hypothetical protein
MFGKKALCRHGPASHFAGHRTNNAVVASYLQCPLLRFLRASIPPSFAMPSPCRFGVIHLDNLDPDCCRFLSFCPSAFMPFLASMLLAA